MTSLLKSLFKILKKLQIGPTESFDGDDGDENEQQSDRNDFKKRHDPFGTNVAHVEFQTDGSKGFPLFHMVTA